ncbi:MAG: CoA-binding protein [Thermodesulfobacteriota bacterium]|nr:CoA-binding protein [Thermodesulfobacteriota bacterium]
MGNGNELDVFMNPGSIAVIGASERPGSWGSFIMNGLLSTSYPGKIYPVNNRAETVFGMPVFKDLMAIEDPIELAVITIPENFVEESVMLCGRKGVKGIIIVTAGFGEAVEGGRDREEALAELAHSYGMRLIGPNVSGVYNLNAQFNASPTSPDHMWRSPIAIVTQGGFAFKDLIAAGYYRRLGLSKFIHTGNECDLTVTDFLEYLGEDEETKAVIVYLETVRDGKRFMEVARKAAKIKPVIVYKAGRTQGGIRAAQSHTGALAGTNEIFKGFFNQAGLVFSPTMELLLPLSHALIERPPVRGKRVCVITMGGSWGVALADAVEEVGLVMPELSAKLQNKLRDLGIPERASVKNPVDIGASGLYFVVDVMVAVGREILTSGEFDALIFHGVGAHGKLNEDSSEGMKAFVGAEKKISLGFCELEKETGIPVFIGSNQTPWESQTMYDLNEMGVRFFNRVNETTLLISLMHDYWRRNQDRGR